MQLELTFGNDPIHLPSVRALLTATLRQFPFKSAHIQKLNEYIDAAIQEAILHAYPAGEQGSIRLSISQQRGKLEIQVRDFGVPMDVRTLEREFQQTDRESERGHDVLDRDVADEVHWLTFGPDGKALQVVKWLHDRHISEIADSAKTERFRQDAPLAPEQEYTIRRMRSDESEQVSQLMYRTYGNTYFNPDVYYPDRVAAQNEHDIVISYVAVDQGGRVVGHYALERTQEGPVVEVGQAVVDPAHRSRGLMDRMKDQALQHAQHLDLVGWYADAVTVHTLTQKSNVAHGGQLTCVDLAIAPKKEHFNQNQDQPQRVTCLLYFHWLKSPTARVLHAPQRHQAMIREIYSRLGCPIEFRDGQPPSGQGTLAVKIDAGAGRATINAESIGENTVQLIRQSRRKLVEQAHLDVVYVDLALQDPASAVVADQLEQDGFGFLGIAPHFSRRGDLLRLAYLVEPIAPEAIHLFDQTAVDMVQYALSEQARVRKALS